MTRRRSVIGPNPPGRLPAAMLRALAAEVSDPGRFSRAKAYARDGAVLDIEVGPGEVRANIQGSRYEPYVAAVYVAPSDDHDSLLGLIPDRDELLADVLVPGRWRRRRVLQARAHRLLTLADEVTIEPEVLARWRTGDPEAEASAILERATAGRMASRGTRGPGRRGRGGRRPRDRAGRPGADPRPPDLPPRLPVTMAAGAGRTARTWPGCWPTPSPCCGPAERRAHAARSPGSGVGSIGGRGGAGGAGRRRPSAVPLVLAELPGGVDGHEAHGGPPPVVTAFVVMQPNIRTIVDSSGPRSLAIWSIDTPARLLRLLVLFSSRSSWSAPELTDRLEVTPRTLRRDVTRLRDLGYPIESTTGRYGGYALGAGGRLPPLLLDDDEAVAVSVGLRELSRARRSDARRGRPWPP